MNYSNHGRNVQMMTQNSSLNIIQYRNATNPSREMKPQIYTQRTRKSIEHWTLIRILFSIILTEQQTLQLGPLVGNISKEHYPSITKKHAHAEWKSTHSHMFFECRRTKNLARPSR